MMTRIPSDIPNVKHNFEILKQILSPNRIKRFNQSEKSNIIELMEKMIQNYNLVDLDLVIDELMKNLLVNDVFSIKIIYYKVKKELLCHNIAEANKFINLGLNKLNTMKDIDKNFEILNKLYTIEKYKCEYLTGVYKESLQYYKALETNVDLDPIIKAEVSLNIGSIYFLTGDLQSCITICNKSFNLIKQMEQTFLHIKIAHLLGEYYKKLGDAENSKKFYKLSLSYSEDQNNTYYAGKNLTVLFVMDYFQYFKIVDDFLLQKLKEYQIKAPNLDFFFKIINIHLSFEIREKIIRLKELIEEFNDQIIEPDILVLVIESLIQFQLIDLKEEYSENKVDNLVNTIVILENNSKKYNLTFNFYKSLLLKSKSVMLKKHFSQSTQILQDAIVSAKKLALNTYSTFFELEIKKIKLLFPIYQTSSNKPSVEKIIQIQEISYLADLFYNFAYRLSII